MHFVLAMLACQTQAPQAWPWQPSPCPPGMVLVEGGSYRTGMEEPLPYAIVDTTQMAVVEAPEEQCPQAMADAPGTTACWVQSDYSDPVVTAHDVEVESYCIDQYPFPGQGAPNPPDGFTTWDAHLFEGMLASGIYGPRRMCSFTEYELAVAGPRSNLRYIYGDLPHPEYCATREADPIGSHPQCRNPETGLYDYGAVISQWVKLDDVLADLICVRPEGCKMAGGERLDARFDDGRYKAEYLVAGGTHRVQTRQAPHTPHTFHDHGQMTGQGGCDEWGWDDGMVVCAEPDPRYRSCAAEPGSPACAELWKQESAWQELVGWCRDQRITHCLSRGLRPIEGFFFNACPEGGGELGSGQGR